MGEPGLLVPPYPVERCAASDCVGHGTFAGDAYLFKDMDSGKLLTLCTPCCDYVELHNSLRFRRVML